MQYLILIHSNGTTESTQDQWDYFFKVANDSDCFKGGSELGNKSVYGKIEPENSIEHIGGFLRFDINDINQLHEILNHLPIIINGGTVDICEMPES